MRLIIFLVQPFLFRRKSKRREKFAGGILWVLSFAVFHFVAHLFQIIAISAMSIFRVLMFDISNFDSVLFFLGFCYLPPSSIFVNRVGRSLMLDAKVIYGGG